MNKIAEENCTLISTNEWICLFDCFMEFFVCLFVGVWGRLKTGFLCVTALVVLSWNSLCRPDWSQAREIHLSLVFQVVGLKAYTTATWL